MVYFFEDFFGDDGGLKVGFVGLFNFGFFLFEHADTGQAAVVHFAFEPRQFDQVVVQARLEILVGLLLRSRKFLQLFLQSLFHSIQR